MKASNQLTILNIEEQTYEDICTHDTTTGLIECTHAQDQGCVRITEIQGKSEQVQSTLGKNLFDKSKVESGSYLNISNNKIVHADWGISDYIYVKGLTSIVASGYLNLGVSPSTCFYDANKTFISGIPGNDDNSRVKITVPATACYMRFSYTVSALDTLQLESGTVATAYEPFTPNSPSPDYPSAINSIGDSGKLNAVSSVGRRNLIPNTNQGKTGWYWSKENGSAEVTDTESFGINACKFRCITASTGYQMITHNLNLKLLKLKTKYTVSFDIYTNMDFGIALWITRSNATGTFTDTYSQNCTANKWTKVQGTITSSTQSVTLDSQLLYMTGMNKTGIELIIANLQMVEGDPTDKYSPAPEDITPENFKQYEDKLSLASVNLTSPLRSLPNGIHDVLECKDGIWGVTRNCGLLHIDETANFTPQNNMVSSKEIRVSHPGKNDNNLICSRFKKINSTWGIDNVGIFSSAGLNGESIAFRIPISSDPKVFFRDNPTDVVYELKTPTWEPLDEPSQKALNNLLSYSGKDYIYTTDPLATNFSVAIKSRAFYENFKLQEEIKNTNSSLGDLDDEIKGGFYDGIINVNEAEAIRKAAETMHTQVTNQFNKVDSNPSLTGAPKTTHQTKYTECNNAYNTLISKINTAIDYCSVDSTKTDAQKKTAVTDMNTAFGTYKTKLADYQKAYQDAIDAIAKKKADDAVDGIVIGGRNLLLDSGRVITTTTAYNVAIYETSSLKPNTKYTFVINGFTNSGNSMWVCFNHGNSDGKMFLATTTAKTQYIVVTTPDTLNSTAVFIYNYPQATATNATINWACMYEGEIKPPLDWIPAPEDTDEKITQVSATLTSTINDVQRTVDKNTKSITDKVWKSDIITGIKDLNVGGINLWDLSAIKRYASGGLNTIVAGTTVDAKTGKITVTADPQAVPGCKIDVSTLTRNSSNIGELVITGYFDRTDSDVNKLKNVYLYYRCFNNANAEIQAHTNKLVPVETSSNLFAGTLSIPANTAYINFGVGQIPYVKPYTLTGVTVKDSALYDITKGLRDQVSQAYQDINGFKQTVSDTYTTKTEFDNLQVGTRNLIPNTNQGKTGWGWGKANGSAELSNVDALGVKACKIKCITASTGYQTLVHDLNIKLLKPNTKYTVSFDIYTNMDFGITLQITRSNNTGTFTDTYSQNCTANKWTKIQGTITSSTESVTLDSQLLYMTGMNKTGIELTIANLQMVEGDKIGTWTPAPEDTDEKFTNYTTTTDMNSLINQTKSDIELGVSRTYTSKAEGDKITQGLNKWILEVYQLTSSSMPNPRLADIENIRGKVPTKIIEVADTAMSATLNAGDYYIGHAFTYLYFDAAYTWSGTIKTDEEGVVYLNGVKKVSTATGTVTNISLPFQAGWNVLEVVYNEGTSNDGWQFSQTLSTLSQCKIMNCYAQVSLNASALIKVTADAISQKVENNSAYSEVVQNAGKMAWLIKSGTSAASMQLTPEALKVVAENIDLTGRVTFSSLATDAKKKIEEAKQAGTDAQESLNNLTIGGRNLLKNSRIRKELTKDSNYVLSNFYLVDGIELQTLVNQDLTLSFYVKTIGNGQTAGTGGTNNRFGIHGSAEWENESGGTRTEYPLCHFDNFGITGKRVSLTQKLTPPAGYTKLIYLSFAHQLTRKPAVDNNETWVFENPKLEISSKATDYTEADEDINASISALGDDLQDQIDGKIESYNQTTNPADAWTTAAIKTQHTGDIWYNDSTKLTQRWSGTAWMPLKDADAIAAQNLAQQKKRVFTATPTTPYDVGDLWVQGGTGEIMKCKTALASGSYNAAHWEKASKYTDDTTANQAVSNTILTPADKISLYATFLSIQNEYSRLKEQCTNLGVADTLKTSYDALYALLNGIVGTTTLQNSITTGFNKSNYDTLYKNYVTAREVLEQAQITKVYAYTNTIKEHFTTEKALAVANWFASQDKTMIDGAYIYTGTVTAKQIAANSIDTDRLAVGMNPNLVRYGLDTMEQFSTVPYFSKSATATVTLDDSQYYIGTKSIKFIGTSDSNSVCLGSKETDYGCVPVTSGKIYILSCYVKTTSTSNVNAFLGFVAHPDISASNIINHGNASKTIKNTDGWVRLSIKYTASSAYPYVSIRINVESPSYPVWFDAFQIEEIDSEDKEPGTFKQAGTTIIDGGNITTGIVKSANYNYSSGNFTIAGTMIDLATGVIRSKGFGMDSSGNSYFNGAVTATSLTATSGGNIAGWNINSYCLYRTSSAWGNSTGMYFGSSGISVRDKFKVDASGNLTATSATINGKITATSGFIGNDTSGFTIGSNSIYNGMSTLGSAAKGIYLGTDGIALGGGKIKATSDGKFYATDADISGNIKLDSSLSMKTYDDLNNKYFYQKILYTNVDKVGSESSAVFCDANLYLKGGVMNVGDTLISLKYALSDELPKMYLRQSGGTITGNLIINSTLRVNNAGIELYGGTPFIDFHHNSSNLDYTQRIIADTANRLNLVAAGGVLMSSMAVTGAAQINTINASADLNINVYGKGVIISRQDATSGAYFMSKAMYDRTYTGQSDLCITSLGTVGRRTSSSMRYKTNITYLTNQEFSTVDDKRSFNLFRSRTSINLDAILNIPVATYSYMDGYVTGGDYNGEPIPGFIAEDIAKIFPQAAIYKMHYIDTETGETYDYDDLIKLDEQRNNIYNTILEIKKDSWLKSKNVSSIPDCVYDNLVSESLEITNRTNPDILGRCKEQRDFSRPEKWNAEVMIPAILYVEQKHEKDLQGYKEELLEKEKTIYDLSERLKKLEYAINIKEL